MIHTICTDICNCSHFSRLVDTRPFFHNTPCNQPLHVHASPIPSSPIPQPSMIHETPTPKRQSKPPTPSKPTRSLPTRQTTVFKPPNPKKQIQTTLSPALNTKSPTPSTPPKGWQSDSFSDYMTEKQRKLRLQFSHQFQSTPSPSTLFKSIVVWIDGYTRPSRLHLTRLIGSHGGRVETYFSTDKVTHVVAENLAAATRKRMKGIKGIKVATPAWIVDSVEAGVRLQEAKYKVKGMGEPAQTMFLRGKR